MCKLIGHKYTMDYLDMALWLTLTPPYHDGIGRSHRSAYCRCKRCNKQVLIGLLIDAETSINQKEKPTP